MNAAFWAWLLSLSGAGLFFVAGSSFTLRRAAIRARKAEGESATERLALDVEAHAQDLADRERERIARDLAAREHEALRTALAERESGRVALAAVSRERDQLRAAHAVTEKRAQEANARANEARRELTELIMKVRKKHQAETSERPAMLDAAAHGDALRTILDRETRGNHYTGAVITDGLGLVVAATGEYGDALAAYGAFLAEVGAKTRDALPLHTLRQVIVQDDRDTTLTVRPIASTEDNLALVTLAKGLGDASGAVT